MRWLKQSTSVDVPIGPFLDSVDGVTAKAGLTITQPDIRLKKNGAAWAQKNAAQTLSHEENGYYEVTLDATDTDTLGLLRLAVNESGAAPIWEDFMILPANVWDSFFGADLLQVDAREWLGGTIATPTATGVPEVDLTHVAGVTTNVSTIATSVATLLAALGTLTDGAADGDPTTSDTAMQYIKQLVNILVGSAGVVTFPAAAAPANAISLAEVIRQIYDTTTAVSGRIPAALTGGGYIQSDVLAIAGSTTAAVNLGAAHLAYITSSVDDAGPGADDFNGQSALSSTDNFYQYSIVVFLEGALQGLARQVSSYTGATRKFLFTGSGENADAPFPTAPANGDDFMIIGRIGT